MEPMAGIVQAKLDFTSDFTVPFSLFNKMISP
jgi:hypothetical protein